VERATRKSIEEYVKPLAVGLDGMANYGDIPRMVEASEKIARGREGLDAELLFLLAVFSGQEKWISRMGHRSRTEIFLTSAGVAPRTIQRLFRGLARFEAQPGSVEEQIVHDAVLLDAMGAYGIARLLAAGYSERMDIPEMAAAIEEALRCKETGEAKVILTALCGHGHLDLPAYDAYLSGAMQDQGLDETAIDEAIGALPPVPVG